MHVWNQNSLNDDWQSLNVGVYCDWGKPLGEFLGDPFSQTVSVLTAHGRTAVLKSFAVKYLLNQDPLLSWQSIRIFNLIELWSQQ